MFYHRVRRADSRNRRHKAAEEHVSVALRLAYWGLRRSCGTVPLTSARGHEDSLILLQYTRVLTRQVVALTQYQRQQFREPRIAFARRWHTRAAQTQKNTRPHHGGSLSPCALGEGRREGGRQGRPNPLSRSLSLSPSLFLAPAPIQLPPSLSPNGRERGREAERERRREQERGREKARQELGEPNPVR